MPRAKQILFSFFVSMSVSTQKLKMPPERYLLQISVVVNLKKWLDFGNILPLIFDLES